MPSKAEPRKDQPSAPVLSLTALVILVSLSTKYLW
jgi:hypothetical protein